MVVRARTVVLAKVESTYGTDPTPSNSANAMEVFNLQMSFPSRPIDRPILSNTLSKPKILHGGHYSEITFSMEIKGSGSAGVAADWGPLVEACGYDSTIVGGTSDTYLPLSTSITSVTFYIYRDGLIHEINGARGDVQLVMSAGGAPIFNFTFRGLTTTSLIDGAIVTPTVDATVPDPVKAATFTVGGYAAAIFNLTMGLNNTFEMIDSVNGVHGYGSCEITDRNPGGSFDPEQVLVATNDYWSFWEDATSKALSIVHGSGAGQVVTITAPVMVAREIGEGDRGGLMTFEIPFSLAESSGDDEISIAIT